MTAASVIDSAITRPLSSCSSFMSALLGDGCCGKSIVAQGVAGTPPRRGDPEEPEPHGVFPWRPLPTLDGGAAVHFPCTARTRRASARRASQLAPLAHPTSIPPEARRTHT